MQRTKIRQTGTFEAVGDDGRRYSVHIFTEYANDAGMLLSDDESSWQVVGQSYKLSNGDGVNQGADGTLTVARTGMELRRV